MVSISPPSFVSSSAESVFLNKVESMAEKPNPAILSGPKLTNSLYKSNPNRRLVVLTFLSSTATPKLYVP